MSNFLKQSTAVVISFGPFVDKADGVTEETGLVSALDHGTTGIKLSKNGGALTIRHASVTATTYDAYGMYRVTLDTTDTNTLGTLRMAFNEAATCLPVWQDFMVLPANVYDSLVGGTDALDVSAIQFAGQMITASGGVTIPAATLASTTNITAASGVTLTATTGLGNQTANITGNLSGSVGSVTGAVGSVTGAVGSVTGAVGSVTGNVGGNVTGSVGSVTAGVTLAASAVQAIWDALTSALTTVGSIGKKLADWVIGTSQTGDSFARLGAPAGASVSADVAAINAKTTNLPAAPASTTNITAATGIDITKILGTAISTPATAGILDVNVKNYSGSTASIGADPGRPEVNLAGLSLGGLVDLNDWASIATIGAVGTDGITAASVKADAVTKIQAGLPAAVADANWDEALSGHVAAGSAGKALADAGAGGTPLDAAGVRAAVGLATANLDTQLSNTYTRIGAPAGASVSADIAAVKVDTAAIKAKTDNLPAAPAAVGDIPTAAAIVDATFDELLSGHVIVGSAGAALTAAQAAADWLENDVPGTYAAGSAGYILGNLADRAVTFVSPIVTGQDLEFNYGFDYLAADGRSEDVTVSTWPALTGATVVLKFGGLTWSVVSVTAVRTIKIAIPRARWADIALTEGSYQQPYVMQATLTNGDIVDLMTGTIRVTKV